MGEPVLIYGKSGSGKSYSLRSFKNDEYLFINVISKRLPFSLKPKYELKANNYELIEDQLSKMPCKIAVIDDAGYLQTKQFMDGHSLPKGQTNPYDLFNTIGDSLWNLILFIKSKLPDDVVVYMMMHEAKNDFGDIKARTIGKLIDEKVCLEGMFTICLRSIIKGNKYAFQTHGKENDIAKSPIGMFEDEIDNDLAMVDARIREFWNIGG